MPKPRHISPQFLIDPEARRVAYHEAGHAVFCYLCRMRILNVTIVPDAKFLGRVCTDNWTSLVDEYNDGGLSRSNAEFLVMALLAGCVAEARFFRRPKARLSLAGGEQDFDLAVRIATGQCGDHDEASAYLKWLTCRAHNTLKIHWEMVDAVATHLLNQKLISERTVRRICRAIGPPAR